MPIPVACPSCGKHGSAPENFAGQRVKCRACGRSFVAQAIAEVATIEGPASWLPELADAQPSPPSSRSSDDNDKTEALIELPVKAESPPAASPAQETYAVAPLPAPLPVTTPRPVAMPPRLPPAKEEHQKSPHRSIHPAIS